MPVLASMRVRVRDASVARWTTFREVMTSRLVSVTHNDRARSPKMCQGGAADAAKSKVYAPPDAPDALFKFADRYDNVRAPHRAALRSHDGCFAAGSTAALPACIARLGRRAATCVGIDARARVPRAVRGSRGTWRGGWRCCS